MDAVESVVRLDDGRIIELTGRPAQGTRHRVLFGRDGRGGAELVLKIELVPGRDRVLVASSPNTPAAV
jgi:hypothetical protein